MTAVARLYKVHPMQAQHTKCGATDETAPTLNKRPAMYHAQTQTRAQSAPAAIREIVLGAPAAPAASPISLTGAQQNELLRALGRADLERLFPYLELVPLKKGDYLYDF